MIFAKKKIILNSAQSNNNRGIVEITQLDNLASLNIKINNFYPKNNINYVFLLKNNDLQQKIIIVDPRDFTCDVDIPIDLEKKISCLLIENGENQIPLFWGGTETQNQVMAILDKPAPQTDRVPSQQPKLSAKEQLFDASDTIQSNALIEQEYNSPNFDQSDIETVVDTEMAKFELIENYDEPQTPQCENCKYKNVFYQEQKLDEVKQELEKIAIMQELENKDENFQAVYEDDNTHNLEPDKNSLDDNSGKDPYYYSLIKTQYEDMFEKYPSFSPLSQIIENSKWVEVNGVDEPYIMGIIYENDTAKYLCYGVIQDKKQSPPIEIADSSQWVPFDISNEFGKGVWLMYQSAENGETIKVEVIA